MKSIVSFLAFLLSFSAFCQLHLDDPAYTYETVKGRVLKDNEVNEMLHSRQHFTLKEKEKEAGVYSVTLVPISDKEFHTIIKEKKRLARKMKGKMVPDYRLKNVSGQPITNHTFDKKKVTVYNFWFTTCPHCIEEIPKLNEIVKDFPEDVTFIAPTFNTHTQVTKFLENNTFDYNIITNGKSLAEEIHIRSYPTHYIVNHEGIIQRVIIGSSNHVIRRVRRNIRRELR